MRSSAPAWICLCLLGCSAGEPRPLDPERSEAAFRARSLARPEVLQYVERRLGRPPGTEWTLEALTFAAFFYHPELDAARARLEAAQAGVATAGAVPNPTVTADLEKVIGSGGPPSPWVYGAALNMPLDFLWKRGGRVDQAEQAELAARLEVAETGWRVRSRLRAALADHLFSVAELEERRFEETVRAEVAKALERRLAAGEIFRLDVDAAQAELATARLATKSAEGRVAESRTVLAAALGLASAGIVGVRVVWADLEKPPAEDALPLGSVVAAGLLNRIDVRRALAEYAAAEAGLRVELAKRFPEVNLGPGYLWDQGDKKFTIGLSFTLPLFNQNGGPIAEAEARRKEVAARFLGLQAQAIGETETALARYRTSLAELAEAEKTIAAVAKREAAVRRAIELGEMDRVALTGVRLETAAARSARLGAVRRAQAALGDLENAVQRPLGAGAPPEPDATNPRGEEKP